MKSKLYKLVMGNLVIREGSKSDMKKQLKALGQYGKDKRAFVGQSPCKSIGAVWNSGFSTTTAL